MNNAKVGTKSAGNKGKGRPKGAKNKVSTNLKVFLNDLFSDNTALLQQDFAALQPFQRLTIFEKLLKYVIAPETTKTMIDFSELTENQLNAIIDRLK